MKKITRIIALALSVSVVASVAASAISVTEAVTNAHKLTEKQRQQIVRQTGFDGFEYIKRLGCEAPIAIYIQTGEWTDQWCYNNYRQLDFSKIDKVKLKFPPVKEKGDSY